MPTSGADRSQHAETSSPNEILQTDVTTKQRLEASAKLANPLAGIGLEQLARLVEDYARTAGLPDEEDIRVEAFSVDRTHLVSSSSGILCKTHR